MRENAYASNNCSTGRRKIALHLGSNPPNGLPEGLVLRPYQPIRGACAVLGNPAL